LACLHAAFALRCNTSEAMKTFIASLASANARP
jgi:hypothetical protein